MMTIEKLFHYYDIDVFSPSRPGSRGRLTAVSFCLFFFLTFRCEEDKYGKGWVYSVGGGLLQLGRASEFSKGSCVPESRALQQTSLLLSWC